jgi:hypothetical protein
MNKTLRSSSFRLQLMVVLCAAVLSACGGGAGGAGSSGPTAPTISAQPANQTVTDLQTVTFSVTASGVGMLNYQWQRNNTAIANATSASYSFPAAYADNGSTYRVVVSNSGGVMPVTSSAATLTVTPIPPTITLAPLPKSVQAGSDATFIVAAGGTAPLTYQWTKNGVVLVDGVNASYVNVGSLLADDGKLFAVTVTNGAGQSITSSPVTLTVTSVPLSIAVQPQDQSVVAPAAGTFSVVATGTGPLSFQWQNCLGNTPIVGATTANYVTPTTPGDPSKQFRVHVSNAAGFVDSRCAKLDVVTWLHRSR